MWVALVSVLLGVQLALLVYALLRGRRLSRNIAQLRDASEAIPERLFQQLEALQALHLDLALTQSLPATRGWAASPDFLGQLTRYILDRHPQVIVECGSGVSSVVMGQCVKLNGSGKVYSLEHDPDHAQRTRHELLRHNLTEFVEILDAPLQPFPRGESSGLWYNVDGLPPSLPIDMLVVDGPPGSLGPLARHAAGPALFPRLLLGATIFLDDANRPDEIAVLARWREEFPELAQTNRDCEKGCALLVVGDRTAPKHPLGRSVTGQPPGVSVTS